MPPYKEKNSGIRGKHQEVMYDFVPPKFYNNSSLKTYPFLLKTLGGK